LAPRALAELCARARLAWWAVTDHDSLAAWRELAGTPGLVPGVEASADHGGREVHLVALGFDPAHPAVDALLGGIRARRVERLEALIAALPRATRAGLTLATLQDGRAESLSRSHLARALVRLGRVRSAHEAFAQWLSDDHTGEARLPPFPPVAAVAAVLRAAGGVVLLAHPGVYRDDATVVEVLGQGLDGLEVDHPNLDPERATRLRALAAVRGLLVSSGSDLHVPGVRRPGEWSLPAPAWRPLLDRLGLNAPAG
jgi:predicted metal-dependent phosphoesterase TrpH